MWSEEDERKKTINTKQDNDNEKRKRNERETCGGEGDEKGRVKDKGGGDGREK